MPSNRRNEIQMSCSCEK